MSSARQPPKPLIIAELSDEPFGLGGGLHPFKGPQTLARALEHFIDMNLRLRDQHGIQQSSLIFFETEMPVFFPAKSSERSELLQPVLRQQTERAIAQRHHIVAAAQCFEQHRQADFRVSIIDFSLKFEPIDAGAYLHARGARRPKRFALGFHMPARAQQFPDRPRHGLRGQTQRRGARIRIAKNPLPERRRLQSQALQGFARGSLDLQVARQKHSFLGEPDAGPVRAVFQPSASVIEQ